jgi:methylamine dehydrogenase accessory protein MauD
MASTWLTIAVLVEGALLLGLSLAVLAHSRLLGLLHMRLGPAGARPLADGPAVGTQLGPLQAKLLDGSPWSMRFPHASSTILVFISPQCQTCNALVPHVQDFVRLNPSANLQLVSTIDDTGMNRAYVTYRRVQGPPYLLGEAMAAELDVEATPYALLVDEAGIVRAKGVVNTYENLVLLAQGNRVLSRATAAARPEATEAQPIAVGESNEAIAPGE